ncbi:MAG: hypothetical protein HY878_04875 [Deltaproteobacteria bacterium]|nr:hypothetical protein [Deltaproteobacteria bacterium]
MKKVKHKKNSNSGNLGFEEKLWQAADKMRGHMDPAEYKHRVRGIFTKTSPASAKAQPLKKSALMVMSSPPADMSALKI